MWVLCPQNEGAEAVETKSGADEAMYGLAPFVSFTHDARRFVARERNCAEKLGGG